MWDKHALNSSIIFHIIGVELFALRHFVSCQQFRSNDAYNQQHFFPKICERSSKNKIRIKYTIKLHSKISKYSFLFIWKALELNELFILAPRSNTYKNVTNHLGLVVRNVQFFYLIYPTTIVFISFDTEAIKVHSNYFSLTSARYLICLYVLRVKFPVMN